MNNPTWPFEEGIPQKDHHIVRDSVANEEWDRICDALTSRRMLSPAWGGMIYLAATTFADLLQVAAVMEAHGRTEELAALHADTLSQYLAACRELTVSPHPSATLSYENGGRHGRPPTETHRA